MAKKTSEEPMSSWRQALSTDMDVAALNLDGEWEFKRGVARHPSGTWASIECGEDGVARVVSMGFGPKRGRAISKSTGSEGLARVDGESIAAWWSQNKSANLSVDGEFSASCAFALELFRIMWHQPQLRSVDHCMAWDMNVLKGLVRMPVPVNPKGRPRADLYWKRRPSDEQQKITQAQIENSFIARGLDKGEMVNMGMDLRTASFAQFATRFMGPDHWEQWAHEMERSGLKALIGEAAGGAVRESKSL